MKLLGRDIERLGWTIPPEMIPPWSRGSTGGVPVDRGTVTGLSAVWACARLLVASVSRMPTDILVKRANGTSTPYDRPPRWLDRPIVGNPNHDWITHVTQVMSSLVYEGNFFTLTTRDNSFDVSELFVLDPREIEITGTSAAPGYKVTVGRANRPEYTPEEVVHRPLLTMPGSQRGMAPIEACRQVFGSALAAQEYAARYWQQNSRPDGGYIAVPQGSKTNVEDLVEKWNEKHQGPEMAWRTGALTGGAEWKPLGFSNEQSQFIESRQFSLGEAARIFGVAPHMIGDTERSTSWGTGIEVQGIAFVTYTLNDYLVLIESAYKRLVPRSDTFLRFNRNSLVRGDMKARGEWYREMFGVGAFTPNRILALEDEAPFEGGDEHYYPSSNFSPIGQEPVPPAAPPGPSPDQQPAQEGQ